MHTSSVTWLALIVMSSTVMSAILLVSKFAAPPVALSSTLWGLEVRGQSSEAIHTHTNKGAHRKSFPMEIYHLEYEGNTVIVTQPHVAQMIFFNVKLN